MAAAPWRHLGDQRTEEVIRIGKALTRLVVAAGAFPGEGVFAARPAPAPSAPSAGGET